MPQDLNKGISSVQYNLLNLPQQVDILSPVGEARNVYTYLADGTKLRVVKRYNSNYNSSPIIGSAVNTSNLDVTKTTDYVGNKIFENNALDRILVDGGYIKDGTYYFYETDHLGDNRTVVNQSGTVVERNDYYPYGMRMTEYNAETNSDASGNDNKYNGKELDVMHGLNLYDYSARSQDPTLGRFTTVDPLVKPHFNISPYAYCNNNPINYIDPLGLDTISSNQLPQVWPNFDPDNDVVALNEVVVTLKAKTSTEEENPSGKDIAGYFSTSYGFTNDYLNMGWKLSSNSSQWHSARQIQQTLKLSGINVQTKAVKKAIPKFFKIGGKVCAVVNGTIVAYDIGNELYNGNYYTAGTHALVFAIEEGLNFVPYVGPLLSIGGTMLEEKYGDDLYKFTKENLDNK